MPLKIFLLTLFLASGWQLWGQEANEKVRWSAQFSFQYQDIIGGTSAVNIGQLGVLDEVKFRPLVSADVFRWKYKSATKKKFQHLQLSYFNNTYQADWLTLKWGFGTERILFKKWLIQYGLDIGVARIKNAYVQYIYENEKWEPTRNRDAPVYDFVIGPRLEIGYQFTVGNHPLAVLITSNAMLHLNTQLEGIIPFNALGLGVRYDW